MREPRLFPPGPTPLHPAVQEAFARSIVHHRTDELRAMFRACAYGLSSRAMEAALAHVLSPGETMRATRGSRLRPALSDIRRAHGTDVKLPGAEWGDVVAPEPVAEALDREPTRAAGGRPRPATSRPSRRPSPRSSRRIARLGSYDVVDILGLLGTLEIVLGRLGAKLELGRGVAAAEAEYLRSNNR
jgi:aspartate aminotransferase-like enzyme